MNLNEIFFLRVKPIILLAFRVFPPVALVDKKKKKKEKVSDFYNPSSI